MRVVLDTNILISACWKPGGNEAQVIALACSGQLQVALSPALLAEYNDVAGRPKFAKHRAALHSAIAALSAVALSVEPIPLCDACSDPDDNLLLDTALAAAARFVVTGNLRHFPPSWQGVQVINARALLETPEAPQRLDAIRLPEA